MNKHYLISILFFIYPEILIYNQLLQIFPAFVFPIIPFLPFKSK